MGMYDGDSSTACLARLLRVPVLLVVDAYGMAESAGALVNGFVEFAKQSSTINLPWNEDKIGVVDFLGVIFNRVASESHYRMLKDSVQGVPVAGYLPTELDFEIPHRHLGLSIAEENPISGENIERLADAVMRHVDIDAIIRQAEIFNRRKQHLETEGLKETKRFRLAVAYDKAFSFYYEDNLDLMRDAGAEIIQFSPLVDRTMPERADAVYIGGGYPELHADALARNISMLESIHAGQELENRCMQNAVG